jgi:hypothetical protein
MGDLKGCEVLTDHQQDLYLGIPEKNNQPGSLI